MDDGTDNKDNVYGRFDMIDEGWEHGPPTAVALIDFGSGNLSRMKKRVKMNFGKIVGSINEAYREMKGVDAPELSVYKRSKNSNVCCGCGAGIMGYMIRKGRDRIPESNADDVMELKFDFYAKS
jgi:hypothetical protein